MVAVLVGVVQEANKLLAGIENSLIVDGIHNVISVLEEIELGRLGDIDFIEAQACPGGCVGGILNVNNRFCCRCMLTAFSA